MHIRLKIMFPRRCIVIPSCLITTVRTPFGHAQNTSNQHLGQDHRRTSRTPYELLKIKSILGRVAFLGTVRFPSNSVYSHYG